MPLHPAWVKNISRRVLWAALERDITKDDRAAMAEYFEGRCAYCDDELPKRWHADHIISVENGGFNHVSNRVPSCPRCNEQEKQERDWLEFLESKCGSDTRTLGARRKKIEGWRTANCRPSLPSPMPSVRSGSKRSIVLLPPLMRPGTG